MKSSLKNRTIFTRDNLEVMRGMADECIDLIYLDPPFNSKHDYAAPIGSQAAGAEFKDTWTLHDIDLAWHGKIADKHPGLYKLLDTTKEIHGNSMMAYLIYMAVRIIEMKRILRGGGSIYLHCDPTASHYLKLMMDEIFGHRNFRNEIVWCYSRPSAPKQRQLSRVHDIVLWYSNGEPWIFNPDLIRQPYAESSRNREGYRANKSKVAEGTVELNNEGKFPESWIYIPPLKGNSRECTGYPTQKPLKLLERIIKASSNQGDLVFDPFCGCATTCVAAEKLDRQWIGIDISEKAAELVKKRIHEELGLLLLKPIHRLDTPQDRDGKKSENIKHLLYGTQEGKCNGCLTHFPFQNFEVDHIVPTSRGGADVDENLQLLCGYCNRVKGDRTQEYLISQVGMTA